MNTACKAKRAGAKKINMNSIGSVIPVRNAVKATLKSIPAIAFLFSGLAVLYIAKATAGNPNINIGKNPVMKIPA